MASTVARTPLPKLHSTACLALIQAMNISSKARLSTCLMHGNAPSIHADTRTHMHIPSNTTRHVTPVVKQQAGYALRYAAQHPAHLLSHTCSSTAAPNKLTEHDSTTTTEGNAGTETAPSTRTPPAAAYVCSAGPHTGCSSCPYTTPDVGHAGSKNPQATRSPMHKYRVSTGPCRSFRAP